MLHVFHQIGSLGQFGLVVAMSVSLFVCPLPMHFFSLDLVRIFAWTESAFWCGSVVLSRALKTGMCSGWPPKPTPPPPPERLHDFFCSERLHDFFLSQEVPCFFVSQEVAALFLSQEVA